MSAAALLLLLLAERPGGAPALGAAQAALLRAPPTVAPGYLAGSRELSTPPQRIVSVAPSVTELLFALGAGDQVRGVSRYDDYPPEVSALPKVGGFLDPNIEAVLALRPDVVVCVPNGGARAGLERLVKLGVPIYVVPGNSFADVLHATRALGRLLGPPAAQRAERLVAEIEGGVEELSGRTAGLRPARVAFVYGWSPLVLAGPASFADSILALLGGENVVQTGPQYPHYALERLIADAPEVILDASEAHEGAEAVWSKYPSLPAVKNKRVHVLPLGQVLRPGPRIIEGMRRLLPLLHPEL